MGIMTAALRPIRGIRRLWISALSGAETRTGAPAFMGRQINNGYGRFKMNILILKLCLVFLVIIAILWMKRPLFLAISGAMMSAIAIFVSGPIAQMSIGAVACLSVRTIKLTACSSSIFL